MSERAITASAVGHGLPTISVDGNDVEAVRAQARQAIAAIQRGPRFLELVTTVRGAMSNPTIRLCRCWSVGGVAGALDPGAFDALGRQARCAR